MTRDTASQTSIEHLIGPSGRLIVRLADWDVDLDAATDDTVRVRDSEGRPLPDHLEVERGTGSLAIRQPSRLGDLGVSFGSPGEGRRLVIEVPAQAYVDVETASGDIEATGLRGTQQFKSASGVLRVDAVRGELIAESVSGDIGVRIDGSIGLVLKTVSGDVEVEDGRVERLKLSTTSGDVRLTSELGPGPHAIATVSGDVTLFSDRGLRITAVTVAGDLRSELPHTSQGGPGRRSLVAGDGSTELQFRSVSGDLQVLDPAGAAGREQVTPPRPIVRVPPEPPMPPASAGPNASAREQSAPNEPDDAEATRLDILRALETGEIDVAEATARLASLDGASDD